MVTGLELLFLEVNNLVESVAFYTEQLGFKLETNNPDYEPPMATVRAGNLRITLAQQLETMLRRGRGVHFFLSLDDVDLYYQQLKERRVEVAPPVDEGWGGRFITIQDPDKYQFFLVTWSNFDGARGDPGSHLGSPDLE